MYIFEGLWPSTRAQKSLPSESRLTQPVNSSASHLLPNRGRAAGLYFCGGSYLKNTASSPPAFPGAWPRRDLAPIARRREVAASLCGCALPLGVPVSPSGCLLGSPSRPALRVSGAPPPGPPQPLPRPGPASPLPSDPALHTMPEQSPRGCEPRRFCPWAGTGSVCAGRQSRRGRRSRPSPPVPAPRVLRERPAQAPVASGAAARPCGWSHPRPPPPQQPWRKFIDVSMLGLKEKPPRNPPHTDMRRSWGWRRPKR